MMLWHGNRQPPRCLKPLAKGEIEIEKGSIVLLV